jgi:chorismate mutase/prephenate dehydratase
MTEQDQLPASQLHTSEQQESARADGAKTVVAFQGVPGAYSHLAAEQFFAGCERELVLRGYDSLACTLDALGTSAADYAIVPVENSTTGSVTEALDLLAQTDLSAIGEQVLCIQHCLIGLEGTRLDQVRAIISHQQALSQCSMFLALLTDCTLHPFSNTAASVAKVKQDGNPAQAAIASERAAIYHGLRILARNLENQPRKNYTRFMIMARTRRRVDEHVRCKTSVILSTQHQPGALVRCLNDLSDCGLNVTMLESRPRPASPFEYAFYIDFEGNVANRTVQKALDAMRAHAISLKVLGSYPAGTALL